MTQNLIRTVVAFAIVMLGLFLFFAYELHTAFYMFQLPFGVPGLNYCHGGLDGVEHCHWAWEQKHIH